jgi:hypothetical protein
VEDMKKGVHLSSPIMAKSFEGSDTEQQLPHAV